VEETVMPGQVFSGPRDPFVLGFFYGIFFLIILYHFLFYIALRDKSYLYHAFFSLALTGMVFSLEGMILTYLLPEGAFPVNYFISNIFEFLLYVTGVQFGRHVLSIKEHSPVLDRILLSVIGISVVSFTASTISLLVTQSNELNRITGIAFGICMVAVLLVIGVVLIRKGNNLTIYYLVGWAALIVFVFIQNARDTGSIGDNFFTGYAFYFGALADELCFSLALTVRINKLKAEKEQERQKIIQADKLVTLGTMASSMAHEIANPNTVVSSNVEFLKAYWDHIFPVLDKVYQNKENSLVGSLPYSVVKEKVLDGITGIARSSERMRSIISQLRDFYSQSKPVEFKIIELHKLIESSLVFVAHELKRGAISIRRLLEPGSVLIRGDTHQIEQVLINLLLNSIAAVRESRSLNRRSREQDNIILSTRLIKEGEIVEISIRDHGIGMDKDTLRQINRPFFTTRIKKGGSGLGLYVSNKIIRDHKGSLTFTSQAGEGTTASIQLPVIRRSVSN
jgi:signal transduction histidine kinase